MEQARSIEEQKNNYAYWYDSSRNSSDNSPMLKKVTIM